MKGAAFYVILMAALLAESDAAPAQDSAADKAVFGNAKLVTPSVRGPRTSWAQSSTGWRAAKPEQSRHTSIHPP